MANQVWAIDITGSCERKIEVIAHNEERAKELACEIFQQLWDETDIHKNFRLFEMDIWEATNATET